MNVFESSHPVIKTKISQLRDADLNSLEVRKLAGQIASILAVESTSKTLSVKDHGSHTSAAGFSYTAKELIPDKYVVIPVLRSGSSMIDSYLSILPGPNTPIYHLGIFREKTTLAPIEYYNKLPTNRHYELAFVLDPVIATGGTARAVIQTLKEWNVKKIVFCSIIASSQGIGKVSKQFPDVDFFVGQIDPALTDHGYINPGLGDIGDRLNST